MRSIVDIETAYIGYVNNLSLDNLQVHCSRKYLGSWWAQWAYIHQLAVL